MNKNELKYSTFYRALSEQDKKIVQDGWYVEQQGRQDPVFFAEYHLGIRLHQGQKQYLRETDPIWCVLNNFPLTRKNLLAPANRWGKTVALAIKHLRFNYYKIGLEGSDTSIENTRYFTLDISPHSNQVEVCFYYILDILHNRFPTYPLDASDEDIIKGLVGKKSNDCKIDFYVSHNVNRHQIDFKNNSSFFGASTGEDSGSSLAGRTFGLITYDECVFSHHLKDELFGRIFSRSLDLNAPIDLISTFDTEAKSQQFFYHLVRGALKKENEWYIKLGILDDNLFIPRKVREEAKEKLLVEDTNKYRQVILGEAVPSTKKAFDFRTVEQIWDSNLVWTRNDLPPGNDPAKKFLISVDWGGSDAGDPTVMLVIDFSGFPYVMVHHEEMKGGSPTNHFATLKLLQYHFNNAFIIMDTQALGGVIIKKLLSEMGVKTYDFQAHLGNKGDAIIQAKILLGKNRKVERKGEKIIELNPNFGGFRSYYLPKFEEELANYEIEDKHLEQDYVVCFYQAAWWLEKKRRIADPQTYTLDGRSVKVFLPQRQEV